MARYSRPSKGKIAFRWFVLLACFVLIGLGAYYGVGYINKKVSPDTSTTLTNTGQSGGSTSSLAKVSQFTVGYQMFAISEPTAGGTRNIPTLLCFPTLNGTSGPAIQYGPFPFVVFSQGFDVSYRSYLSLVDYWVQNGFVVAMPQYPGTDPASPTGVNRADIVNHPADLSYVIDYFINESKNSGEFHNLINDNEIGAAGQSDGGDVTLAATVDSVYKDPTIKAIVLLSAAEYSAFSGTYFSAPQVPIYISQGTNDTINPPYCSIQIYDSASAPKYYVELMGADHLIAYTQNNSYATVVDQTTTTFLDQYLLNQNVIGNLQTQADVSGVSTLITGNYIAPTSTYCPGAP